MNLDFMKIILYILSILFLTSSLSACYTAAVAGAGAAGGYVLAKDKEDSSK